MSEKIIWRTFFSNYVQGVKVLFYSLHLCSNILFSSSYILNCFYFESFNLEYNFFSIIRNMTFFILEWIIWNTNFFLFQITLEWKNVLQNIIIFYILNWKSGIQIIKGYFGILKNMGCWKKTKEVQKEAPPGGCEILCHRPVTGAHGFFLSKSFI